MIPGGGKPGIKLKNHSEDARGPESDEKRRWEESDLMVQPLRSPLVRPLLQQSQPTAGIT